MLRRIEASLAAGGFTLTRDSVAGRQAVIGRLSGMLPSRRHTFVLLAVFKADATRDHLDRFLQEAGQYARTAKGGPGVTAVAVAVVDSGARIAGWAVEPRPPGSAAVTYPVLVDAATRRVTVAGGGAGPPRLQRLIRDHVVHPNGFDVG